MELYSHRNILHDFIHHNDGLLIDSGKTICSSEQLLSKLKGAYRM